MRVGVALILCLLVVSAAANAPGKKAKTPKPNNTPKPNTTPKPVDTTPKPDAGKPDAGKPDASKPADAGKGGDYVADIIAKFPGVEADKTGAATKYNFIISDAGSSGTRIIVSKANSPVVTFTKLPMVTDVDPKTKQPKVAEAFKMIFKANPEIQWMTVGSTAGARNALLKSKDIVTSIGYLCKLSKLAFCKAGIMYGTTEGFLGWYNAFINMKRPKGLCYMELGGASSQLVAEYDLGNVKAKVKSSGGGHDDLAVYAISGVQLGFNPVSDAAFAPDVVKNCDASDAKFDFSKCKPSVVTFQNKDKPLSDCVAKHKTAFANCKTIFLRGDSKTKTAEWWPLVNAKDDKTFTTSAACKAGHAKDKYKAEFNCARGVMWNTFYNSLGTKAKLDVVEKIEWYNGWRDLMIANFFNEDIADNLLVGQTTPNSDCITIKSNFNPAGKKQTPAKLRLRMGKHKKQLRLRF